MDTPHQILEQLRDGEWREHWYGLDGHSIGTALMYLAGKRLIERRNLTIGRQYRLTDRGRAALRARENNA